MQGPIPLGHLLQQVWVEPRKSYFEQVLSSEILFPEHPSPGTGHVTRITNPNTPPHPAPVHNSDDIRRGSLKWLLFPTAPTAHGITDRCHGEKDPH